MLRKALVAESNSIYGNALERKSRGEFHLRGADFVEAKHTIAGRADEMHVLIFVLMCGAFGRTDRVGSCSVQVKNFMQNTFFFEASEDTIQRYTIYFVADNFF